MIAHELIRDASSRGQQGGVHEANVRKHSLKSTRERQKNEEETRITRSRLYKYRREAKESGFRSQEKPPMSTK